MRMQCDQRMAVAVDGTIENQEMNANTETKVMWKLNEHVVWRVQGELLVVLDTVSGHYYTLNEVAVYLWRGLFEEKKSFETVMEAIRTSYPDAPDAAQLEADCRETIAYWMAEKLLEPVTG